MSPFAAGPPSGDAAVVQKLVHDSECHPSYNVVALTPLEGSDYILTGDGKGCISAWRLVLGETHEEPEFHFQAHDGAISALFALRSSRVPDGIEERSWPEEGASAAVKAALRRTGDDDGSADEDPEEEAKVLLEMPKKPSLMARCCSCCPCFRKNKDPNDLPDLAPRDKKDFRHWAVATAAEDGAVKLWRWQVAFGKKGDTIDVEPIGEWRDEDASPLAACLELPDGHLAVAKRDKPDILLIDPSTAAQRWVLFGHTAAVTCFALSFDGRLVSGGMDGAVRLWDRRAWWEKDKLEVVSALADEGHPLAVDAGEGEAASPAGGRAEPRPRETPGIAAGVSSMALFAHMHQEEKSECVATCLRVLVQRAEHLTSSVFLPLSEAYVSVVVTDGDVATAPSARTPLAMPFGSAAVWDHEVSVGLTRWLTDGGWELPECSELEFEVFIHKLTGGESLFARCSMSLHSALAEARAEREAVPLKLFAPTGQGPYEDLRDAVLYLTFEQKSERHLRIFFGSIDGLPGMHKTVRLYAQVTLRQSTPGKAHRLQGVSKERTKVIYNSHNDPNPYWNEIIEVDLPASLRESAITHGPGICLHFRVQDYDHDTDDDCIGSVTLPLTEVLQYDGGEVRPFNLEFPAGSEPDAKKSGWFRNKSAPKSPHPAKSPRSKSPKSKSGSGSLRAAADAKGEESRLAAFKPSESPRLWLGFCLVTPCPVQLRCTVEQTVGMPLSGKEAQRIAPYVRTRLIEGSPMLSDLSSFKTSTKKETLKPAWRERCVLPVPIWLVQAIEGEPQDPQVEARRPSVRAGWEHPRHEGDANRYAVVFDMHDRDILSADDLLGRAVVPFATAWRRGAAGGSSAAMPFKLRADDKAVLYVGFERTPRPDQLIAYIEKADNLPLGDAGRADPFVVVRIAELDDFGEPPDRSNALAGRAAVTEPAPTGMRDYAYRHEEILELPGRRIDDNAGRVAVRPNWHVLFEVLDANSAPDTKEPVLAHASIPLSELLDEVQVAMEPSRSHEGLRQRLLHMRNAPIGAGHSAPKKLVEFEEEPTILNKELALVKVRKRQELGTATPGNRYHPVALEAPQENDEEQRAMAEAAWAAMGSEAEPQGAQSATSTEAPRSEGAQRSRSPSPERPVRSPLPEGRRSPSPEGRRSPSPEGRRSPSPSDGPRAPGMAPRDTGSRRPASSSSHEPTPAVVAAVQALGAGGLLPVGALGGKRSSLIVRFEVVDRWKGATRGAARPLARPMERPTPVTSVVATVSAIVAGHEDGNIFVWDASGSSPRPLHSFSAHKAPVGCIAFIPTLDCIATGGGVRNRGEALTDAVVRLWTCTDFRLQQTVPLRGARARVVHPLDIAEDRKKSTARAACVAISTDTRAQRVLQMHRIVGRPKEPDP